MADEATKPMMRSKTRSDQRCGERGGVMLIAMVALAGLAGLGGLSLLVTRGGLVAAARDRFQGVALRSAESGVAAGMSYLRWSFNPDSYWTAFVSPSNEDPRSPAAIAGNGIKPGVDGNLFSSDLTAWYEVSILNNPADPGFAAGTDLDGRVILRSIGHGPDGATVILEAEVSGLGLGAQRGYCGAYGQRGLAEDGAGRNDCIGEIDGNVQATYRPEE